MKKILFLIILNFNFLKWQNINSMPSNSNNSEKEISGILDVATGSSQKTLNLYTDYTFKKLFNLHMLATAEAYEFLPTNSFKKNLDKFLKKYIQDIIQNGTFDSWLKQFKINKFRKKIIEETITIIVPEILDHGESSNIIKTCQKESIIKTIAHLFYYKIAKKPLTKDFDISLIMLCKKEQTLNFSQKFSLKYGLPQYILEQLLEIAPYLYGESPITTLYLTSNQLEAIPETIECLSDLEKIYLDCNNIKTLPQAILKLPKLNKIIIDKELFMQLPNELKKLFEEKGIKIKIQNL